VTALPGEHGWSEDALFSKALVYVQKMEQHNAEDWEYGFWSSLSLEFLCRAAVAHVSPTLLADRKDWRNTHYALGNATMSKQFLPRSAQTKEVLDILTALVPGFTESTDFCVEHAGRRNAELHSGDLEFKNLETGKWLPKYYAACKTLLKFIGKTLNDLFEEAATAEQLIAASGDAAAKAVGQDIAAHIALWNEKSADERTISSSQSQVWASREKGHRVQCPACKNTGLLRGAPQGTVTTKVNDDEIIQKQTVIPASFECIACGLRIAGLSKLVACGLGNAFTETSTSSAADFFGLYTEDDMEHARANIQDSGDFGFEDDNNE
jgi:hypothetical protein